MRRRLFHFYQACTEFVECIVCVFLLALIAGVTITSCNSLKDKKDISVDANPIARVYDEYLYESDLKGVGADAATPEDSIKAVKNYIDSWIRQELVLRYAKENLPEELEDIEKQIDRYRRQLIVFSYERELVAQKLDTVVNENEIQKYYDDHRDAFALRTGLFNAKFVRLRNPPPSRLDSVRKWIKNSTYANNSKLNNFCKQYGIRYNTTDTTWYTEEDLSKYLPLVKLNWDNVGFRNGFAEATDSSDLCMIKVNGYKFKGSDAPLSYVRNDIYNVIINKRKLDYINKVHETIYEDALKSKKFETFQ